MCVWGWGVGGGDWGVGVEGWGEGTSGGKGGGGEGSKSERRTGPQIISDSLLKANVLAPAWLTENTEDECTGKIEIPKVEFMAVGTARKALF